MALDQQLHALAQLACELGRANHPGMVAETQHPGDQLAGVGISRDEDAIAITTPVLARGMDLAVAAEVTLDLPGDPLSDPDLRGPDRVTELPIDAIGVYPRIKVRGALEVVLGLGRIADLAADPGETKDADRVALVRAADDVELSALIEQ